MSRAVLFAWQAAFCLSIILSLYWYLGHDQLSNLHTPPASFPGLGIGHEHDSNQTHLWVSGTPGKALPTHTAVSVSQAPSATPTTAAITPASTKTTSNGKQILSRLECPSFNSSRYEYLKVPNDEDDTNTAKIQYFFALDIRERLPLLPRLLGSIVEAIRFLGPEHCALSIIEGNSHDGTGQVLEALRSDLDALHIRYYFNSSVVNPKEGHRIDKLAELRNLALQPMLDPNNAHLYNDDTNTTVVFLNDVAICPDDILELVHQRHFLGADMTCAMDWTYARRDPTFYDVWVARTLAGGDSFFEIPSDGHWNSAWNLFWNEPTARHRFSAKQPFQVFSCWNGATAFTTKPFLENKIKFRGPREGECMQGEPQLLCKDLWWHGYGKIAVVPTVNLE